MTLGSAVKRGAVWFAAGAVSIMSLIAAPVDARPPAPTPDAPGQGGLDGANGRVESLNVPARIFRVAVVPGQGGADTAGDDVWAMGHAISYRPTWDRGEQGQLVFLRNKDKGGWVVVGPPTKLNGQVMNPILNAFALTASGEGWAVGQKGTIVHRLAGSNTWEVVASDCQLTCASLEAVALHPNGGEGFAVGSDGTVLRLEGQAWSIETQIAGQASTPASGSPSRPELKAVALAPNGDAWAVSYLNSDYPNARGIELFRRSNTTEQWSSVKTGWPAFDDAAPVVTGDRVRVGVRGAAAASDGDGTIWFGGSFFPIDPANPNGDPNTGGEASRPFVLRFKNNAFLPYCTAVADPTGQTEPASMCGESAGVRSGEFPAGAYPITTLSALRDGQAFAGGLGLYHYRPSSSGPGRWFLEPNPLGPLASVAFANGHEGWFAATGGANFEALPRSDSIAVAHYTSAPKPDLRVARWAYPTAAVPYGVAVAPDGNAPPVAVGDSGNILMKGDLGWDATGVTEAVDANGQGFPGSTLTHFAVDYAGNSGIAWAVGERGYAVAIEDGRPKNPERPVATRIRPAPPAGPGPGRDHLYGVAFASAQVGYAVGDFGALVRYDATGREPAECFTGACWKADAQSGLLTQSPLYDVEAIGDGFVAVGDKGVLLVNKTGADGGWVKVTQVSTLLKPPASPNPPTLYAVDTLADGTIVAGGERSTLIVGEVDDVREDGGVDAPFALVSHPPEGTLLDLRARKEGTTVKVIASLAPKGTKKFAGTKGGTTRGWLVDFDGTRWRDLQESSNRLKALAILDDAMSRDPVYSIAIEPGGRSGWAVGGRWGSPPLSGEPGQGGHDGSSYVTPTRSIYRFDLDKSPKAATDKAEPITADTPADGFSFAFFADTACGSQLCSLSAGTGTAADEVALRIRDDINEAHRNDPRGGPQFVLFGGSSRGSGTADEVAQFAAYLAEFEIPVFGVPGKSDLTPPPSSGQVSPPGVPITINLDLLPEPPDPSTVGATLAYQRAFGKMPFPWGGGEPETGFNGIGERPQCGDDCRANTHYAFDYAPKGERLARFVFLDTSTETLSKSGQNPVRSQSEFLTSALSPQFRGNLTTFIVMNQPTRNPSTFANDPHLAPDDITTIENAAFTAGTTAAFTGGVPVNATYSVPQGVQGAVPFYVAGTGGTPLGGTQRTSDARFHSWLLATVQPKAISASQPQAPLTVRAIPIVESVSFKKDYAMLQQPTVVVRGGQPLALRAFGRSIDGGGKAGDTKAMNRLYLDIPVGLRCPSGGDAGDAGGGCFNQRGIRPDYRFVSENPDIADFVYSAGGNMPIRTGGRLAKDSSSGLLCTFRTGQVWVRVESGGRIGRLPITVVPGTGPCVVDAVTELPELSTIAPEPDEPRAIRPAPNNPPAPPAPKAAKAPAPPPPPKPVVPAAPQPEPVPVAKPVPKVFLAPSPLAEIVPALMPPAPSLLPSPAPPASATAAGAQKQEDKEVQHESASEDGADFTAIAHRRDYAFDPVMGWMLMGVAALLGVFGAGIAATKKGGAGRPAHARITYPRELR